MLQNDVSRDHPLITTSKMPNLTNVSKFYYYFRFEYLLVAKYVFLNSVQKCFDLRCHLDHLSIIFLFQIMTVRDEKMFLVVSRD